MTGFLRIGSRYYKDYQLVLSGIFGGLICCGYLCDMSHTALTYHLVFSTYRRQHVINQEHERELYKYMHDLSKKHDVLVRRIGGMPDHVHMLCDIPAKIAVSEFVKLLKTETSKFMRVNPHFSKWLGWSEGYGGFTIDASLREARKIYIMNQREHHSRIKFEDEYRNLLNEAGFSSDTAILGADD